MPGFSDKVTLIDRECVLSVVGPAEQMLDPEKLGRLYGRVVRFAKVGDKIAILIGDGAPR